jgi:hypothetical protein
MRYRRRLGERELLADSTPKVAVATFGDGVITTNNNASKRRKLGWAVPTGLRALPAVSLGLASMDTVAACVALAAAQATNRADGGGGRWIAARAPVVGMPRVGLREKAPRSASCSASSQRSRLRNAGAQWGPDGQARLSASELACDARAGAQPGSGQPPFSRLALQAVGAAGRT